MYIIHYKYNVNSPNHDMKMYVIITPYKSLGPCQENVVKSQMSVSKVQKAKRINYTQSVFIRNAAKSH